MDEVAATLDDVLAVLAGEIVHDLAGTSLFFEGVIRTMRDGMDAEDHRIALEELGKLRELVRALRELKLPSLSRSELALAPLVEEACRRARPALDGCQISVQTRIDVAERTFTDGPMATRALAMLLRWAAATARPASSLALGGDRRELRLVVTTDGVAAAPPRPVREARGSRDRVIWLVAARLARALEWELQLWADERQATIRIGLVSR